MNLEARIQQHFAESLKAKQDTLARCVPSICPRNC
jgi:hypothetical protein